MPLKAAEDDLDDVIDMGQGDAQEGQAFIEKPWKHDTWQW